MSTISRNTAFTQTPRSVSPEAGSDARLKLGGIILQHNPGEIIIHSPRDNPGEIILQSQADQFTSARPSGNPRAGSNKAPKVGTAAQDIGALNPQPEPPGRPLQQILRGKAGKKGIGELNPQPEPPGRPLQQILRGKAGKKGLGELNPQPEPPGRPLSQILRGQGGKKGIGELNPQPEPPGRPVYGSMAPLEPGPTPS